MGWKDWDRTNRIGVVAGAIGVVVLVVLLVVLLTGGFRAGTQLPTPGPTPTSVSAETSPPAPSPTFSCSTATGPECTEDLAAKEAARDKAYADAEAAYRAYESARIRGLQAGGGDVLPTELRSITGPDVQRGLLSAFRLFNERGWVLFGTSKVSFAPHQASPEWPTTQLVFTACVDDRSTTVLEAESEEFVRRGTVNTLQVEMRQEGGRWLVWEQSDLQEVSQC